MAGREGLIDTACKTAETGYLQRRIGKILESDHVASDGSVRDGENNLILPVYGGDGMDPESHLKIHIGLLKSESPPEEAARRWCGRDADDDEVLQLSSVLSAVQSAFRKSMGDLQDHIFMPFDPEVELPASVRNSQTRSSEHALGHTGTSSSAACDKIGAMCRGAVHFKLAVRAFFTSRQLKESRGKRETRSGSNRRARGKSKAPSGMMCGTIAAQSIGEPATQMTLVSLHCIVGICCIDFFWALTVFKTRTCQNTFHSAGAGNKTVQRGVSTRQRAH